MDQTFRAQLRNLMYFLEGAFMALAIDLMDSVLSLPSVFS